MNRLTNDAVQVINDDAGHPLVAILPFAHYQALMAAKTEMEPTIPSEVVEEVMLREVSPVRAWRTYLGFTQKEVAQEIGITQGAYAQLEAKMKIRKSSRIKVAKALHIDESQLDF